MAEKIYNWTDDPMVSGVADCNTDVVNDCLMHLKYENTSDAIQNMYETGQVEKQTRGYNQLVKMKRSTFDKSKFTVVGNPTITDDGVASGFSVNNNIKPKSLIPFGGKSWEFGVNFIPVNNTVNDRHQAIFTDIKDTKANFLIAVNRYGNRLVVIIRDSTNTNLIVNELNLGDLNLDIINSAHLTYKNQKLTIVCNGSIVLDKSVNLDDCTFNNSQTIGYNSAGAQVNYGAIDLKSFSITVDGAEVFNGNKTGIDTIKADNYEVVGSPVISDDGIASGFSKANYISTGYTYPETNDIRMQIAFTYIENASNLKILLGVKNDFSGLSVSVSKDNKISARLATSKTLTAWTSTLNLNTQLVEQSDYLLELIYRDKTYTVNLYKDRVFIETKSVTIDSNYSLTPTIQQIGNGLQWEQVYPFSGTIDLNAFKIYVDGKLVYQPCLKIPYTQSKTGSKIADGVYRDRVQDVYEQFGTASYYTIDETNQNFTLPMGEIYGMIEDNASKINGIGDSKVDKSTLAEIYPVVKTYINGASWYRVYSDNWCEQGGIATISGNQTLSISLMKAYTNTTYSILQSMYTTNHQDVWGYGNKVAAVTTSSFSLYNNSSTSGNICWRTSGYIGGSNEGIQ